MTFMVTYAQILFILKDIAPPEAFSNGGCFFSHSLWIPELKILDLTYYHCQDIANLPPPRCSSEDHSTRLYHQPLDNVIYWPWSHFPSFGKAYDIGIDAFLSNILFLHSWPSQYPHMHGFLYPSLSISKLPFLQNSLAGLIHSFQTFAVTPHPKFECQLSLLPFILPDDIFMCPFSIILPPWRGQQSTEFSQCSSPFPAWSRNSSNFFENILISFASLPGIICTWQY